MSTSVRERAIKLLGNNVPQHLVASATGVTESYITQLLEEDGVRDEVAVIKAASLEARVEESNTIDVVKKEALAKVKEKLIWVKDPLQAARIFQILDNAKSKQLTDPVGDNAGKDVVTITLPAAARANLSISLNAQNQVIDVEGRSMAPLPSKALPKLMQERKEAADAVVKLPAPTAPVTLPVGLSDSQVAAVKLLKLPDISTMIDGVQFVL